MGFVTQPPIDLIDPGYEAVTPSNSHLLESQSAVDLPWMGVTSKSQQPACVLHLDLQSVNSWPVKSSHNPVSHQLSQESLLLEQCK